MVRRGRDQASSIADLTRSVEWIIWGLAAVILCLGWMCSPWLATHWLGASSIPTSTIATSIALMVAVAALRLIEGIYRGALLGLQRHLWVNGVSSALATVLGFGAVAVLAWFSPTILAFFIWQFIGSAAMVVILEPRMWRALPKGERPPQMSLLALRSIWRFAAGMLAVSGLVLLLTQLDKIILSRLLSLDSFAHYALAAVLANGLAILTVPIATVFIRGWWHWWSPTTSSSSRRRITAVRSWSASLREARQCCSPYSAKSCYWPGPAMPAWQRKRLRCFVYWPWVLCAMR